MGRPPHGYLSRTASHTQVSAAYDRAATADRMQARLEDAGYTVDRKPDPSGRDVTIVVTACYPDGFAYKGGVYTGPKAVDALALAVSDLLQQETMSDPEREETP